MPINSFDPSTTKFQKGFLNDSNHIEDPTYFGFKVLFDFSGNSPLFHLEQDKPSAYQYLINTNRKPQAELLKRAIEYLTYLSKSADYYFQSIKGLKEIWKVDMNETKWRGTDKIVSIETLEGMDLNVTAMIDAFRKATFELEFMRELLPTNLRWFRCYILISEFRQFHSLLQKTSTVSDSGELTNNTTKENELNSIKNLISTLTFELDQCHWNFDDSFSFLEEIDNADPKQVTQSLNFHVGQVRERNEFQLLDLITDDKSSRMSIGGKDQMINVFGDNKNDEIANKKTKAGKFIASELNEIQENVEQAVNARKARLESNLKGVLGNVFQDTVGKIKSEITSAVLGNVYNFTEDPLRAVINSFIGNKSENLNIQFKSEFNNTQVNQKANTPDFFSANKIEPTKLGGTLDSYEFDQIPVNRGSQNPEGYPDHKIDTNGSSTTPEGYVDHKIPTNNGPNSADGFPDHKINPSTNGGSTNSYDDHKIKPSDNSGSTSSYPDHKIKPSDNSGDTEGFPDHKIETNKEQKAPSGFPDHKLAQEIRKEALSRIKGYEQEIARLNSRLETLSGLSPEVNKEGDKPSNLNLDVPVNQNVNAPKKLDGFDATQPKDEKLSNLNLDSPKTDSKIVPDSFNYDDVPVNQDKDKPKKADDQN